MMICDSILQAIGHTPIVRLNRVIGASPARIFAKLEMLNPGGSIKDRIGYWLIEDAERRGALRPGGTIVEGTSGNTGFGLAIAAAIKGYQCIFVLPDKMSEEKIRNLRAFGARVIVTPTAVEPEDSRSYYSVSRRLASETPNALYIDQYNNLANRDCHYRTTGPEILEQMPGIDVLVAGIGTGGTICGVGKYLKEKKPDARIVAVDPVGSIVYDVFKTGKAVTRPKTYKIEGIGEDFIPANYDFSLIDEIVQVSDKEAFLMTRSLLTKEGIFSGISSGAAVMGALKYVQQNGRELKDRNVLVILPDSGDRYLSKVFNDDWMREAGFLEASNLGLVADLLLMLNKSNDIVTASPRDKVSAVIEKMRDLGISQLPVLDQGGWIKGIVTEASLLKALYEGRIKPAEAVEALVDSSVEFVSPGDSIERVSRLVTEGKTTLVTDPARDNRLLAILTKIDLLSYLGTRP
jgi:cystathionine beta-synthase